jgi:hypothetical protein
MFLHLYLPLLTQETAIMLSTFVYGLKEGAGNLDLLAINTTAIVTDLLLFFLPIHFLCPRLHDALVSRSEKGYKTGRATVRRFGDFRTAAVLGLVLPSVTGMIVVGLLRLSFWRALGGLFVGSAVSVVLPLLIALPLASTLPRYLLPALQWTAPTLMALYLLVSIVRWQLSRRSSRSSQTWRLRKWKTHRIGRCSRPPWR